MNMINSQYVFDNISDQFEICLFPITIFIIYMIYRIVKSRTFKKVKKIKRKLEESKNPYQQRDDNVQM